MMFWLGVLLLSLLAALFVLHGLRPRAPQTGGVAALSLYRDRLRELERERELGVIAEDIFNEMRRELEQRYLREAEPASMPAAGRGARWAGPLLATAVIALSLVLYLDIGAHGDWRAQQLLEAAARDAAAGGDPGMNLAAAKALLETRLERDPERQRHRYALASLALEEGDLATALAHYRELVRQLPRDADVLAQAAQVAYLEGGRVISGEVREWTRRALEIDPNQGTALGTAGIDAFEQGDYARAREVWQRLLAQLPEDSAAAGVIAQGLREAQSRLLAADPEAPRLEVSIQLDEALPSEGVLFVFARAAGAAASSPPVAVVRLSAPRFPLSVVLDDTAAMLPDSTLSGSERVVVVARLSRSGQAGDGAGVGDLEAVSEAIAVQRGTQRIELELHPLGG